MLVVITDGCAGTKSTACVDVCPVDCIHPTAEEAQFDRHPQLYVDPVECIGCAACLDVCPVAAIYRKNEVPADQMAAIATNAAYYRQEHRSG